MSDSSKKAPLLRILIADDESINRLGIRCLLAECDGLEVIADVGNGIDVVQLAEKLHPDVILMDIKMPGMDGIAATRAIRKMFPGIKILMLTSANGQQEIFDSLEAGANGYCLKDSNPDQFMTAISVVMAGNVFLDSKALPLLLKSVDAANSNKKLATQKTQAYEPLSESELEVLSMKMRGITDDETSRQLSISLETLRRVEEKIKQKIMDLENRPATLSSLTAQTSGDSLSRFCEVCESSFPPETENCPNDGAVLAKNSTNKRVGTTLDGKYEILSFIGKGGGASVFKARHKFLNQLTAIKIIHPEFLTDFTMLQRFRTEAELSSQLNHPNIIKVYDFGVTESGTPYLAMELVDGISLSTLLQQSGALEWNTFVAIFWQVCSALECAHANKLIHRDIKPSNILISKQSSGHPIVKLVDFGLAKTVERKQNANALTLTGQVVGTPDYMSPETCKGEAYSVSSDIYSLGCTMFECATGRVPYSGESMTEVMYRHMKDPLPHLAAADSDVEDERQLAAMIMKCMSKSTGERFADAAEIKILLLQQSWASRHTSA